MNIENRGAPEGGVPPEMPPGGSAGMRTITMYRNGFTVDNGPFRCVDGVGWGGGWLVVLWSCG